jgi:sarcosine/dimethylglycine N-methyltransferase
MSDTIEPSSDSVAQVREHYRAIGLTGRLRTALLAFGPQDLRLTPQQLAPLDQFHTRGLAATADLAGLAQIGETDLVLDVGAGVGGPARFVAASCLCRVVGIDLSAEFIDAARYLTERTGQSDKVSFETANALDLPFDDARFDGVLLQHVAMNVRDRAGLYRQIRRVLKTGGRLATFDVVKGEGEPHFPLPWARTPETSFLLTAEETRSAIETAGFRILHWRDDTDTARAWFAQARAAGPAASPNLGLVIGPDFPAIAGNLGRNLVEGRVRIVSGIAAACESNPATASRTA